MLDTLVSIVVAAIAALVAYFLAVRRHELEEQRKECAKAIADAMAWLELPYRIRRRADDLPTTRTALVERMHALQEALYFHENWLRIEMPRSQALYTDLVTKIKDGARQQIQQAWEEHPADAANLMNLGDLGVGRVDEEVEAFAAAVRQDLSWWRLWRF